MEFDKLKWEFLHRHVFIYYSSIQVIALRHLFFLVFCANE